MSTTTPKRELESANTVATARYPVSVIILTWNEEHNIRECLENVAWADEVIIVDSHSDDATIAVARDVRPDAKILANPFKDFGAQRNWALDQSFPRHEWILFLDADERSTPQFAAAVRDAIENTGGTIGYYLCYRNLFLSRWIKRCTLYPSWQLRLLKLGHVRYRKMGHGQSEVTEGPLDYLHVPYDHFGFSKGVEEWIARHNRYSSEETDLIYELQKQPLRLTDLFGWDPVVRRRCLKRIAARVGFRPLLMFVYRYVWRMGFLDGLAGFRFCLLRAAHEIHISIKLAERRQKDRARRAKSNIAAADTDTDDGAPPADDQDRPRDDEVTPGETWSAPKQPR